MATTQCYYCMDKYAEDDGETLITCTDCDLVSCQACSEYVYATKQGLYVDRDGEEESSLENLTCCFCLGLSKEHLEKKLEHLKRITELECLLVKKKKELLTLGNEIVTEKNVYSDDEEEEEEEEEQDEKNGKINGKINEKRERTGEGLEDDVGKRVKTDK